MNMHESIKERPTEVTEAALLLPVMENYMLDEPNGWGDVIRVTVDNEEMVGGVKASDIHFFIHHNDKRFPTKRLLAVIPDDSPAKDMTMDYVIKVIAVYLGIEIIKITYLGQTFYE